MSISADIANYFKINVSAAKCKIGEVYLFQQLIEAITVVGFPTYCINPTEIHGAKSFVEFISSGTCGLLSCGENKKKELADILFLAYSPRLHKCRISFKEMITVLKLKNGPISI